jgi:transcriptional regulator with XRE-family HTH domain
VELNAEIVRDARKQRGWTQQHMADACDVSLRTVQRVEKLGVASPETLLGLCAVLEVDHSELLAETGRPHLSSKTWMIVAGVIFAFAAGLLLGRGL